VVDILEALKAKKNKKKKKAWARAKKPAAFPRRSRRGEEIKPAEEAGGGLIAPFTRADPE